MLVCFTIYDFRAVYFICLGVPTIIVVTPEEEQVIENGGTIQFQVAVEDQAGNPTSSQKLVLACKVCIIASLKTLTGVPMSFQ